MDKTVSFMADDFAHLKLPLKDVKEATGGFSKNLIGGGGFGKVFVGELFLQKGRRMVAFKRLDRKHGQGDVEFWREIMLLSELRHKNLVSLLYFCFEDDERILVYKYASRMSLDHHLGDASVTWIQRLSICLGAAKGIAYLHDPKKKQQRVLHRDIKSSNILLDDKWTAKVSDFGLSKLGPANQPRTYLVSNVVGTPGYCDPMYWETGKLSKECDVYSFGVVLFEVMCGRLCCEFDKDKFICILVRMWRNCYNEDRLDDIIFPDLKEQINQESLLTFAAVANRCLERDHKKRPNMVEIIKELEVALYQQKVNIHKVNGVKKRPSYGHMEEFQRLKIGLHNIKLATYDFSTSKLIGRGGFGKLYAGVLSLSGEKSMVCFKRLDRRLGQGIPEFWKEIMMLSNYKHENLISLLHFCDEGDETILVYEYAPHGSLDCHLSSTSLTWTQRLKICVGVAHALNYLHNPRGQLQRVLHRDIKSSNILLDENWTPKVSDFGVSGPTMESHTYIEPDVFGTPGYCDPLYWETGVLTKASDVYSFGVVLLEVLSGKLCFEYHTKQCFEYHTKQPMVLVPWWKKCYEEKRLDQIIFSDLKEQVDSHSLSLDTFSAIAFQCVSGSREERPPMAKVIRELELALEQQVDFEETMRMISPTSNTSQNQLLLLFQKGILVADGRTWLSKLKNGNVCEVISAINCIYADSLVHDIIENSRFSNVSRGKMNKGFTVKARTRFLTRKVTYAVNLVFKHSGTDHHGTHIPFKFKFDSESHYSNSCIVHAREDGWLMVELTQFTSYKREHDFGIEFLPLFNATSSSVDYFFEGIEFRPIQYVS